MRLAARAARRQGEQGGARGGARSACAHAPSKSRAPAPTTPDQPRVPTSLAVSVCGDCRACLVHSKKQKCVFVCSERVSTTPHIPWSSSMYKARQHVHVPLLWIWHHRSCSVCFCARGHRSAGRAYSSLFHGFPAAHCESSMLAEQINGMLHALRWMLAQQQQHNKDMFQRLLQSVGSGPRAGERPPEGRPFRASLRVRGFEVGASRCLVRRTLEECACGGHP